MLKAMTDRRMKNSLSQGLMLLLALSGSVAVMAQQPNPSLAQARLSPTLYFQSASEELASRNALHEHVSSLTKEVEATSVESLPGVLDSVNTACIDLQRHLAYLRVRTLDDTQDREAKAAQNQLETDRSVLDSAVKARLRQIPDTETANLGAYTYLAQQAKRDSAHALSPDAEQYRGKVVGGSEDDLADAYDRLVSALPRPKNLRSPDAALRSAAVAERTALYNTAAPVAATLLAEIVNLENRDAVAQGFADASARKYEALTLSSHVVQQTLAQMQGKADLQRRYEEVLAEHAKRKLQLSSVTSADVPLANTKNAPLTLDQASQLIRASLQPLGADYTHRFAELLNPNNGRLDLSGGAHRARTGTSISAFDAPVAFYFDGYDGSLDDVSVIIHEGGHAIHRELMNAEGIPVYQRGGPHFLFEGFAMFNELLLLDHAVQVAKSPSEREYALESLLSNLSGALFLTAEETAFERSLYTGAVGHSLLSRTQIDAAYQAAVAPYEYWPTSDTATSYWWIRKSLVFEDPLYEVNYLYAALVAVALYDHAHSDPDFASKYESLLREGFYADPTALLAPMGIHLDDPTLIENAARLFQTKTEELQHVYTSQDAQ